MHLGAWILDWYTPQCWCMYAYGCSVHLTSLPVSLSRLKTVIIKLRVMPRRQVDPPDGGYGYLVLTSSFLVQLLFGTMIVGMATLMVEFIEEFQSSHAAAAAAGAIACGAMTVFGESLSMDNCLGNGYGTLQTRNCIGYL